VAASDGAAFRRVLDALGREIVGGSRAPGTADTVDAIVGRTGASRSVVREATRVLVSLGMLSAGPRVGLRVRPRDEWDLLDPQVIRWRLAGADRATQLEELRGVRLAVEPEAARRAAERATPEQAAALEAAGARLRAATEARDAVAFVTADQGFHAALLAASGNAMLVRLGAVIDEALRERVPDDAVRWELAPADVAEHRVLAGAIRAGDGARAAECARRIVEPTRGPE